MQNASGNSTYIFISLAIYIYNIYSTLSMHWNVSVGAQTDAIKLVMADSWCGVQWLIEKD